MTTTTGKDSNNGKDDNGEDNGDNGEGENSVGGNGNSGGGGISAGGGQGNIRLVAVLCRVLVVWCLHTIGIIQISFRI